MVKKQKQRKSTVTIILTDTDEGTVSVKLKFANGVKAEDITTNAEALALDCMRFIGQQAKGGA